MGRCGRYPLYGHSCADYEDRRYRVSVKENCHSVLLRTDADGVDFIFLVDTPFESWFMMVVQIEKPANMTLAAWFTELRSWFDENNCQPVSFVPDGRVIDKLIFNVSFAEDAHARSFASKVTAFAP
jgi:hypothetical protein